MGTLRVDDEGDGESAKLEEKEGFESSLEMSMRLKSWKVHPIRSVDSVINAMLWVATPSFARVIVPATYSDRRRPRDK